MPIADAPHVVCFATHQGPVNQPFLVPVLYQHYWFAPLENQFCIISLMPLLCYPWGWLFGWTCTTVPLSLSQGKASRGPDRVLQGATPKKSALKNRRRISSNKIISTRDIYKLSRETSKFWGFASGRTANRSETKTLISLSKA